MFSVLTQICGGRRAKTHVTVTKVFPEHAVKAYRSGGTPPSVLNIGIRWICGQTHVLAALTPEERIA
jgi:hypothetical protein